jgi:hypothetical protein
MKLSLLINWYISQNNENMYVRERGEEGGEGRERERGREGERERGREGERERGREGERERERERGREREKKKREEERESFNLIIDRDGLAVNLMANGTYSTIQVQRWNSFNTVWANPVKVYFLFYSFVFSLYFLYS